MSPTLAPSIVAIMGSRSFFGAERANIDLMRMMHESGARVTCVVREEDWPENLKLRQFIEEQGLEWRKCQFASFPALKYWRYWPNVVIENFIAFTKGNRIFREICDSVGATHIHTFSPFMTVSFLIALNRLNLPLIYRCGDYPTDHNVFWRTVWRWLAKRVAHFGTESRFVESLLIKRGILPAQISVIPAPAPQRDILNKFVKTKYARQNGQIFVYIGQISAHKGVDKLIDAFYLIKREKPNVTLFIAGPINDDWAHSLRDKSLKECRDNSIVFLEHVEDVPGLLLECDVHVAPTIKAEPYGLVTVEAKAAARPSIVFAGGGHSELVEDGVEGIVVREKTAKALAEAMLAYCRDRERARADGGRALASLTQRIGTDQYAQRWRAIYDSTMPTS